MNLESSSLSVFRSFVAMSGFGVLFALQDLQLQFCEEMSMEPKSFATTFVKQNKPPCHNFETIGAVVDTMLHGQPDKKKVLHCSIHGKACALPPAVPDLWVCGFPCAPYSCQRSSHKSMALPP